MNLYQPVSQLYLSVDEDDVLRMNLSVNDVVALKILHAFKEGDKCIAQFVFREEVPFVGSDTILQFHLHVRIPLGVEESVSVEEWPEEMGVMKLLQKGL